MSTERLKRLGQMNPDHQLEFIRASCLSLASAIQGYQDSLLEMIADRHDLVSYLDVDGQAIGDAIAVFKEDLFIRGYKVTGKGGSK
jgi:hypothetical protein